MNGVKRGLTLLLLMVAALGGGVNAAVGQVATTTVQDTVYLANGQPAAGSVVVSWTAFTTAEGAAVPAGSTTAVIAASGLLTMSLAPNAGAMPMGSYYTAAFHLSDGTTSREYWVIPAVAAGGATVKLAAIRSTVLPASVALQTVSKRYVDAAIARAALGGEDTTSGDAPYVVKTGDSMTGPLQLPGSPTSPLQAADKNYVDASVTGVAAGVAGKVSLSPVGAQTIAQPAGTQLGVNALNGVAYASQYQSGDGGNGVSGALGSAGCASGCDVQVEQTYASNEPVDVTHAAELTHVTDRRGGGVVQTFVDPLAPGSTVSAGASLNQVTTRSTDELESLRPGIVGTTSFALTMSNTALGGGNNAFPSNLETPPNQKSTFGVSSSTGNYFTQGQHVQTQNNINCFSVGDCLAGSQVIVSSGGYRDVADEGTHPYDLALSEDTRVFRGVCASGCTTGSTALTVTTTADGGTEGDGRFLMDVNPAKAITAGTLTGGGRSYFGVANFTGTSFPTSVFLVTAQLAGSQATKLAPGTVTLPIATSGLAAGFATSTAALPATSGVACVADPIRNDQEFPNFETALYKVIDATHVQLTLRKVHASGAFVAVGGLCGYGLEQKVDTLGAVRQVFPVVGSISGTSVYYADALTPVIGQTSDVTTSGYHNLSLPVVSLARASGVVTATLASDLPEDVNGLTLTLSGAADASYNGSFAVVTTGSRTLTFANAGANSTTTGGTLALLTGTYGLYPMAEVISVLDPATKKVDGALTLAANTVAWAANDAVEEPHYYQMTSYADTEFVTQYEPRPVGTQSYGGKTYSGELGPGFRGWSVTNGVAASNYIGGGGLRRPPVSAYVASGVWQNSLEVDAGELAVLKVHCNLHGCNRWDSGYPVLALDSARGQDFLFYDPSSDTASWNLAGAGYSFSPSGFAANTINAGTVNATSLNGPVGATTPAPGSFTTLSTQGGEAHFVLPNAQYGYKFVIQSGAVNQQAIIHLNSGEGTNRWQIGMDTDNSFIYYDNTGGRVVMNLLPSGGFYLMPSSGSVSVGAAKGAAQPGLFNVGGANQFQVSASGNTTTPNVVTTPDSPANGSSCGTHPANAMWADDNYVYHCLASGSTAKRVALSSF